MPASAPSRLLAACLSLLTACCIAWRQVPTPAPTPAPAPAPPTAFGYDVFQSGIGPITDGPVDDQYLLSAGDEIVVSIWGELNETLNLTVTSEGFVELPEKAGRIATNGLTLKELRPRIEQALSQIYAAYINAAEPSKSTAFVDIRLGRVRPLLVYVMGEVSKPGAYGVSASAATVLNLLTNAGGVRQAGSLREIKVRRADGSVDAIDLYGLLLKGEVDERRMRLRPGDYVIVPLKRRAVTVSGEVRRPLSYELVGSEGLREAIDFAGGLGAMAYLKQVQVRTTDPNRGEIVRDIDLTPMTTNAAWNLPLADGDSVQVGKTIQARANTVTIGGDGITRPGTYEWKPGMRLSDLVARAEGLREHALLERADLVRTEDDFAKKLITFSLAPLYQRGEGAQWTKVAGDDVVDLPLREMDEVIVQSGWGLAGRDKTVTLTGHVKSPGAVTLARGMTLQDLLFMRGGFQDPEFLKATYTRTAHLTRKVAGDIGQKLITFDVERVLAKDPGANLALEDGDEVRVFASAELTGPRTVRIDGEVQRPGTYPLSEDMTLQDLVVLAGGVSPRIIKGEAVVARPLDAAMGAQGDDRVTSVTMPLAGDGATVGADAAFSLRTDDRITIRHQAGWEPLDVASVRGQVRYPGAYALPQRGQTLTQLIERAGGLRPEAFPEGAVLQRRAEVVTLGEARGRPSEAVVIDLAAAIRSPGSEADLVLREGDELFVPSSTGTIAVSGAVRRPATLQHRAAMKLSDYLASCGGLTDSADVARITITAPNNAARLVAKGQDPVLAPGSSIEVPLTRATERLRIVEVKGAVAQPAMVQFTEGAKLGYYLTACGGFAVNADVERVSVLLPDGRVLQGAPGASFDPPVPAGAIIMVTTKAAPVPAAPAAP
jgi:protein involved in polysaccharide export with SLBB domain